VVAAAVTDRWPYGNFVILETPRAQVPAAARPLLGESGSLYHLYAHLLEPPTLEIGQAVECGQVIGRVGNSGWSGNAHLHFEARPGPPGVTFTGMEYYRTTSTAEDRANYERWRFGGEFVPLDPLQLLTLQP